MFSTVLVANRGEIALRVMRACRELGLRTIAVYSEADQDALHVRYADDAVLIGPSAPAESYLNIEAIIAAARRSRAGAIHPGYGFLAENPAFVRACELAGLQYIGPSAATMDRMGGKAPARREAMAAGVPVVPGTTEIVPTPEAVRQVAEQFGYPIAIKASAGGGGRGLKVAANALEVDAAFAAAQREALAYFNSEELYVEKYLTNPRHIEVQILADTHGRVLHLGERDCSIQRRHQKLIEEAPSPALNPEQRAELGASAVRLARHVGYTGAGTLEFLWQGDQPYFLEMNTRIQVEHTITEAITGIDLVRWQILVAQGERLPWTQDQIETRGHAIECRINAEDPADQFRPSLGTLTTYHEPQGFGVRVDSGYRAGMTIPPQYDSLVAKLIAWGQTREEALARMRRALHDFEITGIRTTIPFHQLALNHAVFTAGEATIRFLDEHVPIAALQALGDAQSTAPLPEPSALDDARAFEVEVNGRRFAVRVAENGNGGGAGAPERARTPRREAREETRAGSDAIKATMGGAVTAVRVEPGDEVVAGQVLIVIEAMKMENEITSPRSGIIDTVLKTPGAAVQAGEILLTFRA